VRNPPAASVRFTGKHSSNASSSPTAPHLTLPIAMVYRTARLGSQPEFQERGKGKKGRSAEELRAVSEEQPHAILHGIRRRGVRRGHGRAAQILSMSQRC